MKRIIARGLFAITVGLFGCHEDESDKSVQTATPAVPVVGFGPFELESSSARTVVLEPNIPTTVSLMMPDGASATMIFPAGSVNESTSVTLTPVLSLPDEQLADATFGAIHFEPEGLTLLAPARLILRTPAGSDEPQAFLYSGEGERLYPSPASISEGAVTLFVTHFSGGGVSSGNIQQLPAQSNPTPEETAVADLAGARFQAEQAEILKIWLDDILFALEAAEGNDSELIDATAEYYHWLGYIEAFTLQGILDAELLVAKTTVVNAWVFTLAELDRQCREDRNLTAVLAKLNLGQEGEKVGIAALDPALSLAAIEQDLCIELAFTSIDLPERIGDEEMVDIDIRAAVTIEGVAVTDLPIQLNLRSQNDLTDVAGTVFSNNTFTVQGSLARQGQTFSTLSTLEVEITANISIDGIPIRQITALAISRGVDEFELTVRRPGESSAEFGKEISVELGDTVEFALDWFQGAAAVTGQEVILRSENRTPPLASLSANGRTLAQYTTTVADCGTSAVSAEPVSGGFNDSIQLNVVCTSVDLESWSLQTSASARVILSADPNSPQGESNELQLSSTTGTLPATAAADTFFDSSFGDHSASASGSRSTTFGVQPLDSVPSESREFIFQTSGMASSTASGPSSTTRPGDRLAGGSGRTETRMTARFVVPESGYSYNLSGSVDITLNNSVAAGCSSFLQRVAPDFSVIFSPAISDSSGTLSESGTLSAGTYSWSLMCDEGNSSHQEFRPNTSSSLSAEATLEVRP